jgi:hypothetical protein
MTELQQSKSRVLRKGRSQFKQEAKWRSISGNHGKESNEVKRAQTATGIETQGKKRTSVTQKRGTALNEAPLDCKLKNKAIAMIKTASRQAAQTITGSNQRAGV